MRINIWNIVLWKWLINKLPDVRLECHERGLWENDETPEEGGKMNRSWWLKNTLYEWMQKLWVSLSFLHLKNSRTNHRAKSSPSETHWWLFVIPQTKCFDIRNAMNQHGVWDGEHILSFPHDDIRIVVTWAIDPPRHTPSDRRTHGQIRHERSLTFMERTWRYEPFEHMSRKALKRCDFNDSQCECTSLIILRIFSQWKWTSTCSLWSFLFHESNLRVFMKSVALDHMHTHSGLLLIVEDEHLRRLFIEGINAFALHIWIFCIKSDRLKNLNLLIHDALNTCVPRLTPGTQESQRTAANCSFLLLSF